MTIKVSWEPGYDRLPRFQWELDDETRGVLERFGIVNELTDGEDVIEQGRGSDALYIVFDGEVAVVRDGREVARLGQSLSFGEMGLLLKQPRSATVRAVGDASVLELTQGDIDRMLEEEPVQAARLYRVLAECLAEYLTKAQDRG